ncbi:uncharacterized protein LOC108834338 [Raphanus sativus]|uniref:Uncharacterized protein LOC108834338 n=1 Tax=Raphanus sativus TaxID=3726 RepID=A0A9W3C570_RAPSA|nr:uncharacterized protein LOC108834338 [Raphanus sativus]
MEDEKGGDGQVSVLSSATMEKIDSGGKIDSEAKLIDVPVAMTTIDEDEATQEWSIPVTHLSEEEGERLAAVQAEKEDDDEEEYWEYEPGEKPSKANKKSEIDAIGSDEEDEEELEDRYEYEIEQSVAEFEDEEVIRRNTIPDSSDEDEDYFDVRNRKRQRSEDKLEVGTAFWSGFEFKEAVLDYALTKGRNIEQSRWDKTKLSFKCGIRGKCKWRVYCAFDQPTQKWLVKTRYKYHSCTPNGKCRLLRSPVIARLFLDKLREDNGLMPEKIQEQIKETWKFIASRNQCQRGRTLALKMLEKEYADQFAHLRGYVREIEKTNPGSSVVLETVGNAAKEDVFDRFYVCFEKLKSSWRGTCRKIIGLDGTFLKTEVKGILLTAVGHDGNNQIFPFAWAVVQAESTDTWLWFIKRLKYDLSLGDGSNYVLLSDSSKGLISAIQSELPNAEHRRCVKHIVENLKKKHKNKSFLKPRVWNLAWSYNKTQFKEELAKLQDYSMSLYDDVMKREPKTWSLAYYKLGSFCDDVDNNATESFNATITGARAKAIVPMLETIRRQAMVRIAKRRKKSERREEKFTKYVVEILKAEKEDADKCITTPCTHGVFEVRLGTSGYNVNTSRKTCTCGKWQITGIPCEHAYGAMIDAGLDVEDYVSDFFSTSIWRMTYSESISTVRGPRFWMKKGKYRLVVEPPEPTLGEGEKKKKKKKKKFPRKKGKNESPTKKNKKVVETIGRMGRIMHCSKCGEADHNAATCKIHPKKKIKTEPKDIGSSGAEV